MEDKKGIKKKIDLIDEQSNQVKELLGKTPNWIIRVGTSIVMTIVFLIFVASYLISYNEIATADVIITSKNPPAHLRSNSTGRLKRLLVEPNGKVYKGKILAVIENPAEMEDVYYIKDKIKDFVPEFIPLDSFNVFFPPTLNLGDIQVAYGEFLTQYQSYILYYFLEPNKKTSLLLERQVNEHNDYLRKQKSRLKTFQEDLSLSNSAFERNKNLFDKGVISKAEFENAHRKHIADRQNYDAFVDRITESQMTISDYEKLLTESIIKGEEFQNNYKQELEKSYQNLNYAILKWEQEFVLKSPINGKVTILDIWNGNQNVTSGEIIFTIVPNNLEEIIGHGKLPIHNSGKVKKGQKVIIKLASYPFQEWGSLEGEITSISDVPKQEQEASYRLYISIKNLTTSYGKTLEFKQEMQGTAEIVLEELTILQRIFYQFREVFNQN